MPSPSVITAAVRAARRVNDFPTAVRIFEGALCLPHSLYNCNTIYSLLTKLVVSYTGLKAKTENVQQYQDYLDELKPLREELGVLLKEDLYPPAEN